MIIDDIALLSAKTLLENAGYIVTKKSELLLGYYKCPDCNCVFSGSHHCDSIYKSVAPLRPVMYDNKTGSFK
jgi:hypothetical protein